MEEKEATLVLPIVKMNPQASLCWEQPHCPVHKGFIRASRISNRIDFSFRHCDMPSDMAWQPHHSALVPEYLHS